MYEKSGGSSYGIFFQTDTKFVFFRESIRNIFGVEIKLVGGARARQIVVVFLEKCKKFFHWWKLGAPV